MKLEDITPLILTWNEEPNLRRCLERLRWAARIVVVDSGSTDGTRGGGRRPGGKTLPGVARSETCPSPAMKDAMNEEIATGYAYAQADAAHTHAYLWEPVLRELAAGNAGEGGTSVRSRLRQWGFGASSESAGL